MVMPMPPLAIATTNKRHDCRTKEETLDGV
jgi:hypothetical protein